MRRWCALSLLMLFASGCHSSGPYGYSRTYSPLDEESDAVESAREYDPVMAQREPESWKKSPIMLFGVVKGRSQGPGGSAYLALSVRTLSERNLCDDFDEDTCRVTVSEKEHALVHARAKLRSGDDIGKASVAIGSLVRIVGKLSDDADHDDGMPVLEVSYYRHWPRNFYVTTADANHMLR